MKPQGISVRGQHSTAFREVNGSIRFGEMQPPQLEPPFICTLTRCPRSHNDDVTIVHPNLPPASTCWANVNVTILLVIIAETTASTLFGKSKVLMAFVGLEKSSGVTNAPLPTGSASRHRPTLNSNKVSSASSP